jgi:hypothetical protein
LSSNIAAPVKVASTRSKMLTNSMLLFFIIIRKEPL